MASAEKQLGKAVVSTAASCLADYGLNNNAEEVHFIPTATSDDSGPIGTWRADKLYIPAC